MGTAKAWLEFRGERMLERVARRLGAAFAELVVVRAPVQELPSVEARCVEDRVEGEGPLAGIAAGLAAVTQPFAFVVSCDVPFVKVEVARGLLGLVGDYDVVVPEWEGRMHPLQAVYRASLAPLVEELLAAGRRRPVDLFDRVRTCVVREDELRAWDAEGHTFINMNTPEEYQAALRVEEA
jgi:molybdopterin-guanine dinucleotide biosynthesis protein A